LTTVDETDAAAAAAAAAASSARRAVDGTYIFQSAAAAAIVDMKRCGSAILVRPQPKAGLCSACVSYVFISL